MAMVNEWRAHIKFPCGNIKGVAAQANFSCSSINIVQLIVHMSVGVDYPSRFIVHFGESVDGDLDPLELHGNFAI